MNMLVIALTILMIAIMVFWFARFLQQSGIPLGTNCNKVSQFALKKYSYKGEETTSKELLFIFFMAIGVRLAVYVISIIATMIVSDQSTFTFQTFIDSWNRWDAPNYIDIANKGYAGCTEKGQHLFLVFFPLYPWLLRIVHVFVSNWYVACLALSTLSYGVGACFFYKVISMEYSKSIAYKSLVLLSVYPFAFFFGGMMTESLFFATMSAGFYFVKKHNWIAVGLVGILCALCRVQGIILLGVAGVEFFVTYKPFAMIREKKGKELAKEFFTKFIWVFTMFAGNIIYFYINYVVEGDWFRFRKYQSEHWYHDTTYFAKGIKEIVGYAFGHGDQSTNTLKACMWIPELVAFALAVALLIYGIRRHPLKYTAYLFVYTIFSYSVTFLISGGRYMLCAFPMFIILGELLDRHPKVYHWVVMCSGILMGFYLTGYIMWKQIM